MSTSSVEPVTPLVEHFFRHQASGLVAVLTRFFGWRNFDLVEDMVQATLVDALQSWSIRGAPENPAGWVHRTAKNKILDALRRDKIGRRVIEERPLPASSADGLNDLFLDSQIEDSQLRMMFACCHPRLARENQLALTLKTLCGFGTAEIARALLVSEEAIKKRLQRATQDLIQNQITLEPPTADEVAARLDAVHQTLYLLFNEGYHATEGTRAIRVDLCEEAARLCHLLCSHDRFCAPATRALMALMLFHGARLDARLDQEGSLLLLDEQDRRRWDHRLIDRAQQFLQLSAEGEEISVFHLEAAIACCHCTAPSFDETNWQAILTLSDALLEVNPSPLYRLNRAIVIAELDGPEAGIRELQQTKDDPAWQRYHYYEATLGELHRRAGDFENARRFLEIARKKSASAFDHDLIDRRIASFCSTN